MHFSSVGVDTENIHNYEKGHPQAISVTINRMQCCLHVAVSHGQVYITKHTAFTLNKYHKRNNGGRT